MVGRLLSGIPAGADPPAGPLHADLGALPELDVDAPLRGPPGDVSDVVDAVGGRADAPVALDLQAPRADDVADPPEGSPEPGLGPSDDDDVVHVAEVPLAVVLLLHVVVQLAEVEVGEVLAGVVAYREPRAGVLVDYGPAQLEDVPVLDPALELAVHDLLVDAREVLPDVELQIVQGVRVPERPLDLAQRLVRPSPGERGVRLVDQVPHDHVVQDLDQRPVDYPVREEWQVGHDAGLALLVNLEHAVFGCMVCPVHQHLADLAYALIGVRVHLPYVWTAVLALARVLVCPAEVLLRHERVP